MQDSNEKPRESRLGSWLRPPLWTFEQYPPRKIDVLSLPASPPLTARPPAIAIVTPTHNHARFLRATIDSVLEQGYPNLFYHVQDGGSDDDTVAILKSYGDRISWKSQPDKGQADAVNLGFKDVDCEIMGFINSDDAYLPGTLAYVANVFAARPDVDVVYGHRIFIDWHGSEIGRAILPAHDQAAFLFADYIPQETMFWRRRVWNTIGGLNPGFDYALDWDFLLRAQTAGFRFTRLRRFLACFRVHDQQKTSKNYEVGRQEMQTLRLKYLGYLPTELQIVRAMLPYLIRQSIFHWCYRLGLLKR